MEMCYALNAYAPYIYRGAHGTYICDPGAVKGWIKMFNLNQLNLV